MFTSWTYALLGQRNTLHNGSLWTGWRKDTWAFSWSKVSKTILGYHLSRNATATVAPLSKLTSSKSESTLSISFTRGLEAASESLASESTSRSWGWSVPLGRSWGCLVLVHRCNQYSVFCHCQGWVCTACNNCLKICLQFQNCQLPFLSAENKQLFVLCCKFWEPWPLVLNLCFQQSQLGRLGGSRRQQIGYICHCLSNPLSMHCFQ